MKNKPNTAATSLWALFLTFSLPVSRPPARLRVRSPADAASSPSFTAAASAAAEYSGGVVVHAKLVTCNMVGSGVKLRNVKKYFLVIHRSMHVRASLHRPNLVHRPILQEML